MWENQAAQISPGFRGHVVSCLQPKTSDIASQRSNLRGIAGLHHMIYPVRYAAFPTLSRKCNPLCRGTPICEQIIKPILLELQLEQMLLFHISLPALLYLIPLAFWFQTCYFPSQFRASVNESAMTVFCTGHKWRQPWTCCTVCVFFLSEKTDAEGQGRRDSWLLCPALCEHFQRAPNPHGLDSD